MDWSRRSSGWWLKALGRRRRSANYARSGTAAGATPPTVKAEVVGFKANRVLLMPLGEMTGIKPGSEVVATGDMQQVTVGDFLLGRVLDGLGAPADGLGALNGVGLQAVPDFRRAARCDDPAADHGTGQSRHSCH